MELQRTELSNVHELQIYLLYKVNKQLENARTFANVCHFFHNSQ